MTETTSSHADAEAILRRIAPPAAAAYARKAERDDTTVLQLVKDALYRGASEVLLEEHPEFRGG